MRTLISTFLLASGLSILAGCNQGNVPEELKILHPVTIMVTDGSQPVSGVDVRLSGKGPQGAYASSATTNANGVAKIRSSRSSYTGIGAPPGTYAVVLLKSVKLPPDLEPQEEEQDLPPNIVAAKRMKREAFLAKNQTIPRVLASSKSPVELTVADNSGATAEIDISKYR